MNYDILERENVPEVLKAKSKWMSLLVITFGILVMTTCAVAIGTVFGYTYCYIEHRCIKPVNYTHPSGFQIVWPRVDSEEAKYNRTINGAIMSSVLVSKIMKMGHALLNNTVGPTEPRILSNDSVRQADTLESLLKNTVGQAEPESNSTIIGMVTVRKC